MSNKATFGPITDIPVPENATPAGFETPGGDLAIGQLDGSGNLKVSVTGAGSGGTSSVDRAGFTAGSTAGTPAMGVYEATPTTVADNQVGLLRMDADRHLQVDIVSGGGSNASVGPTGDPVPSEATLMGIADPGGDLMPLAAETLDYDTGAGSAPQTVIGIALPASGGPVAGGTTTNPLQVGDAGGSLTVDGTVAATQSGTWNVATVTTVTTVSAVTAVGTVTPGTAATSLGKAEDAAHTSGDVGVMALGVANAAQSTLAADGDYIPLATDVKGNQTAVGNIAHDGADAGNPVKVGGVAFSPDGTTPGTAVSEGDRSNLKTDLNGRLFVNDASPQSISVHLDGSTAYTDQALFPDPGDGFQVVMTFLQISTGAATAMSAFLEEGSTKVWGPLYFEAVNGRGYVSGPIHKEFTASTAVTITTSASIAQGIDATYFIQAV